LFCFDEKRKITINIFFTQLLGLFSQASKEYKSAHPFWQPESGERLVQKKLLSGKIGKILETTAGLNDLFGR